MKKNLKIFFRLGDAVNAGIIHRKFAVNNPRIYRFVFRWIIFHVLCSSFGKAARCASRRYGEMTSQSGSDFRWETFPIVHLETAVFLAYFVGFSSVFLLIYDWWCMIADIRSNHTIFWQKSTKNICHPVTLAFKPGQNANPTITSTILTNITSCCLVRDIFTR